MAEPLGVHRAYYLTVVEVPMHIRLESNEALLQANQAQIVVEPGHPTSTVYLLPSEEGERLLQAWEEAGHRSDGGPES